MELRDPAPPSKVDAIALDDEKALVRALRRGDARAFDAVYERYRARLFAFLVRLSRSRHVAEDLLQETWLRLARHALELDEDTRLLPWLYTVARNLHTSHRRWSLLDAERLGALRFWAREADELSPFERMAANETERKLERALAALPVAQREVVLLVCVERMEPTDAARVVGLAPEAFRQRLSRARAALADALVAREERVAVSVTAARKKGRDR